MKKNQSNKNNNKSSNVSGIIDLRLQKITAKLEQIELDYIRESTKLKEEIAEVRNLLVSEAETII